MSRSFATTMVFVFLIAGFAACRDREQPKINVDQISNVDDTAGTDTANTATTPSSTDAVTLTGTSATITDTGMTTATSTVTATVPK